MKQTFYIGMLTAALAMPFAVGCDDTKSKTETKQTSPDGTVSKSTDTVKEKSDGSMVHESTKTVDRPDAPDSKDKVKVETGPNGEVKKAEETHK